jgi:hypothetical protein
MSPTISFFATIAQLFATRSPARSPVVCPASSTFFFYFMGESFFATPKQKGIFFYYPAAKRTRVSTGSRRMGNQIPRGIPSTVLLFSIFLTSKDKIGVSYRNAKNKAANFWILLMKFFIFT